VDLALACDDAEDVALLRAHGWGVIDALPVSLDADCYRRYIGCSRGELTVAKDQNVRMRSGWFSDRSACYLASGRPVVTQDTGFGEVLPTGQGLFSFRDIDDAVAAIEAIESDLDKHSEAALEVAASYFRAETVLADLLARMGC
jgi:glycosyltransferase involved in cell wall biosynthesis